MKLLLRYFPFSWDLVKLATVIFGGSALSLGTGLIFSVLLVRYLGMELYGVYAYFTAIAALPPVFYSALSNALARFVPTVAAQEEKVRILLGVALWQLVIAATLAIVASMTFWVVPQTRFWENHLTVDGFSFVWVVLLMLMRLPVGLVNQWLSGYAATLQKIGYVEMLNAVVALLRLGLMVAIWLAVEQRQQGLEWLLAGQLLLSLGVTVVWMVMHGRWGQLWHPLWGIPVSQWGSIARSTFQNYIRSYAGPIQLQAISSLVKNYVPVLILGQQNLYTETAYYRVLTKVFELVNKILPNLFVKIFPRIVSAVVKSKAIFQRKFISFTWWQILFYISSAWLLIFTDSIWLGFYSIESSEETREIIYFFAANLIFLGTIHPCVWAINLSKSTVSNLFASMVRSTIILSLMLWAYPLTLLEVASINLLATVSSFFLLLYFASRTNFFFWKTKIAQLFVVMITQPFLFWMLRA
jgi:O-antigen/teichoic acid export membrane protein